MDTRKNYYKLVSAVLVVSFIAPSVLLWPEKVWAQDSLIIEDTPVQSTVNINEPEPDYSYLAPTSSLGDPNDDPENIIPAPNDSSSENWQDKGCAQLVGDGVKKLFKKTVTTTLKKEKEKGASQQGIPTFDIYSQNKLDEISDKTDSIQEHTGYLFKKANCLDSLAKFMMKTLIQKVTLSIINWINYGRDGKPLFLSDPAGYFANIAKEEIQGFGLALNNSAQFPFGKAFFTGLILDYKMKFEDQASYSLDKLIARTNPGKVRIDFNTNFNTGGWGAWLGMTYPQNNPIGFNMIAADELSVRLAGTQNSRAQYAQESIRDATGFLGDERCAAPEDVTHKEDAEARNGVAGKRLCKKWVYVTPGKLIADLAIDSTKAPIKRLELADDINSALAAIADAGVNKFFAKLTDPKGRGLLGFSEADNTGTFDISTELGSVPINSSQFPDFFVAPGTWISGHLDFKMQTDVTQAFVDEQRTYLSKMGSYNNALNTLILDTHQLDYCIPGPHPGWEEDSRRVLTAVQETIPAFTEEDMDGKSVSEIMGVVAGLAPVIGLAVAAAIGTGAAAGATAGSVVPGLGTVIGAAVGIVVGLVASYIANHPGTGKRLRIYYELQLESLTGLYIDYKEKPSNNKLANNIADYSSAMGVLDTLLDRYADVVDSVYSSPHMPAVTQEAAEAFKDIPGYRQIVENNIKEIAFRKGIITRLESVKKTIDDLNAQLKSGAITGETYEENFKSTSPLVTEFSRLSAYFVEGDDIASIDNLYKQAVDRANYVYDDLLKGPHGCEADLICKDGIGDACHLPWQVQNVERMTYPFPKLYNYGTGPMSAEKDSGPGFLSFVLFTTYEQDDCLVNNTKDLLLNEKTGKYYRIAKEDLIPERAGCTLAGKASCGGQGCAGAWETTIGIY